MKKRSLGCIVILEEENGERSCVTYYGKSEREVRIELEEIGAGQILSIMPFEDLNGRVNADKLQAFLSICDGLALLSPQVQSFHSMLNELFLLAWEDGYQKRETFES